MNEGRLSPARGSFVCLSLVAGAACLGLAGCLAYTVVAAPVKVAATTVVVAGETTGAVVETTGKVAVHAVRAAGSTADTGIEAAARLSRVGMITFADTASGTVVRIPWRDGLRFASASAEARVATARRVIQIVRAGRLIYANSRSPLSLALQSGDVVRLVR